MSSVIVVVIVAGSETNILGAKLPSKYSKVLLTSKHNFKSFNVNEPLRTLTDAYSAKREQAESACFTSGTLPPK